MQQSTTRAATNEEIEDSFRKVIDDVIPVVQRLVPLCNGNAEELIAILELAQICPAQLRMILREVTGK